MRWIVVAGGPTRMVTCFLNRHNYCCTYTFQCLTHALSSRPFSTSHATLLSLLLLLLHRSYDYGSESGLEDDLVTKVLFCLEFALRTSPTRHSCPTEAQTIRLGMTPLENQTLVCCLPLKFSCGVRSQQTSFQSGCKKRIATA